MALSKPPAKAALVTKPAPKAAGNTALTTYEAKMAELAQRSVATESSVTTGNYLTTKAGILGYNGKQLDGNKIDVVVCDAMIENAYYGSDYDEDNPQPPVCFAFGRDEKTMAPHPDSAEPQSEQCQGCKWNQFKTDARGKGKACKNIRRLGLIPIPSDRNGAMDLNPDALAEQPIAYLKVPVTSVKGWALYVRTLDVLSHRPPAGVATEIKLRPDAKTQFAMEFRHIVDLPPESGMAVLDRLQLVEEGLLQPYSPPSEAGFETEQPKGKGAAPKGRQPAPNTPAGRRKF